MSTPASIQSRKNTALAPPCEEPCLNPNGEPGAADNTGRSTSGQRGQTCVGFRTFHAPDESGDVAALVQLRARLRGWAYAGEEGRDLRIDLLRGRAVLAMVIDHLAGPSKLYLLTGGNHFYTSAAEGFIFLSGLTVGLVYRRIAQQQGLATAIRRLVERAWTLYVLTVGLTLVMLPVSELLHLP